MKPSSMVVKMSIYVQKSMTLENFALLSMIVWLSMSKAQAKVEKSLCAKILLTSEKWGDKVLFQQAMNDQFSHTKTYFFRGLTRPWSTNLGKWLQAILILTGLKKLKSSHRFC